MKNYNYNNLQCLMSGYSVFGNRNDFSRLTIHSFYSSRRRRFNVLLEKTTTCVYVQRQREKGVKILSINYYAI